MFKCDGKIDCWTIASMKLATVAFVIVVLKLWSGAMIWIYSTNIWWFIGAFVIFVLRAGMGCECCKPTKKINKRKKK